MYYRRPPIGSTGCKWFQAFDCWVYFFAVLHPWQRYIDRGVRTYTWAPVNGTDYRWALNNCEESLHFVPQPSWSGLFSCSLALVLPKYSEHFIQAKLGDDMKQAMCEYSTRRPHPSLSGLVAYLLLLVHGLHSCCFACSELERQPLLHMCRSDQIPAVLFFCSVTRWSVGLNSPARSSTCFPSARRGPGTSSFDLRFSHLPLSSLPSSCPPSGITEDEASHTSSSLLLWPL